MKKSLALLLAVLLLCGCVAPPVETEGTTEPTTMPTTQPTETTQPRPVGLYQEGSDIELLTQGAVRAYPLKSHCNTMGLMGEKILVFFDGERTQVHAYAGEEMILEQSASMYPLLGDDGLGLQTMAGGMSHYDIDTQTLVILDNDLKETARLILPDGILDTPIVSQDRKNVYYCDAQGICVMDVETGISHPLRRHEGKQMELMGLLFDGNLLACRVTDGQGNATVSFIQTGNGQQLFTDHGLEYIYGYGEDFFLLRHDEDGSEHLFGTREGDMQVFYPDEGELMEALALGGMLIRDEDSLDLFDLATGLCSASLSLEGLVNVRCITPDERGYIWFLACEEATDSDVLYRWEVAMSPADDETVYTSPRYTEENPNVEALEALQDRAAAIADIFGIRLRVGMYGNMEPWQNFRNEHRVDIVDDSLTRLEQLLAQFPEGFLERLGWISDRGALTISLVREMENGPSAQIWYDGSAYIVLEIREDMSTALYTSLYRVIDTFILDEISQLDEWDAENPAQDRNDLFVAAMTANNGEYFADDDVQYKLYRLCRAIRYAFGLRRYESMLPWEQYLDEPLY